MTYTYPFKNSLLPLTVPFLLFGIRNVHILNPYYTVDRQRIRYDNALVLEDEPESRSELTRNAREPDSYLYFYSYSIIGIINMRNSNNFNF